MRTDPLSNVRRRLVQVPSEQVEKLLRRIGVQLEFARTFSEVEGREEWIALVESASKQLAGFNGSEGELQALVLQIEKDLAPIGEAAKKHTIHCVGHGHIDMNWMWSWPETVATTHDTFASVLSLMRQYPEFTYSQSQTSVYALVEKYYPEMFEEIRQRVREGRWEITAVHWVEGDKNLSSGESLCRHMLLTRAYFADRFGLKPEDVPIDWEPDTFGHANTIPSFLSQGAARFYYSCRQGGGMDLPFVGEPRPALYHWQAPDGSRVLVNRELSWYNSYVNIGDNIAEPMCRFYRENRLHHWLNVYGIGNHGGGPTRKEIDYYLEIQSWPIYPKLAFSTSKRYFEAVEQEIREAGIELPVLQGELNFELTGCFTSQSLIKQANRFGENYCVEAETLAAIARASAGYKAPAGLLTDAWIKVLFNQFHDILPGSGVRETREHAMGQFQEVGAITGSVKRSATGALASQVDTAGMIPATPLGDVERELASQDRANTPFVSGAGIGARLTGYSQTCGGGRRFKPYVVYNPCAWTRTDRVTVALYDTGFDPGKIVALDSDGVAHPTFLAQRGKDWDHEKITLSFYAKDVPGLGYRTYLFCEGFPDVPGPVGHALGYDRLATPALDLGLDRYLPGVVGLRDKRTGRHVGRVLGAIEYAVEQPRGMTAWVLGGIVGAPERCRASWMDLGGVSYNAGTGVPSGEGLCFRADHQIPVVADSSSVRLTTWVHSAFPRIDFCADLDWREIGTASRGIPSLMVAFDTGFDEPRAIYETPFGWIERDLRGGEEVASLNYVHLWDDRAGAGLTFVQDCKYGHSLDGSIYRMRLIRSSFDPDHAPEVNQQRVRYAVHVHDQRPSHADLARLGLEWNHPLMVVPANIQQGTAPRVKANATVLTPEAVLHSLKDAHDGNGLTLRLASYATTEIEAQIELSPELLKGRSKAQVVDLMERPTEGAASIEGSIVSAKIAPRSFVTIKLS